MYLGEIYNNDHPSTPVVVGDLTTLRTTWRSDDQEEPPEALCVPDLSSRTPVLLRHGDEIWLLAEDHDYTSLLDTFSHEELVTVASAPPNEVTQQRMISVPSGRLAIALADVDGTALPETLDQESSTASVYTDPDDPESKVLVTIPVPPGDYEITVFEEVDVGIVRSKYEEEPDRKDRRTFLRCRIRRSPS